MILFYGAVVGGCAVLTTTVITKGGFLFVNAILKLVVRRAMRAYFFDIFAVVIAVIKCLAFRALAGV